MSKSKDTDIAAAISEIRAAESRVISLLEDKYPIGSEVMVYHYRGGFRASVTGHRRYSHNIGYVVVRNIKTGKASNRYYEDVQLIDGEGS